MLGILKTFSKYFILQNYFQSCFILKEVIVRFRVLVQVYFMHFLNIRSLYVCLYTSIVLKKFKIFKKFSKVFYSIVMIR